MLLEQGFYMLMSKIFLENVCRFKDSLYLCIKIQGLPMYGKSENNCLMRLKVVSSSKLITVKDWKIFMKDVDLNVFEGKFKEISFFSLNSGNLYVTLQPELCPFGL